MSQPKQYAVIMKIQDSVILDEAAKADLMQRVESLSDEDLDMLLDVFEKELEEKQAYIEEKNAAFDDLIAQAESLDE